jgi:hypothetical protein
MPLDALLPASNTRFHEASNLTLDRFIGYIMIPFKPTLSAIKNYSVSNAPNPAHTVARSKSQT